MPMQMFTPFVRRTGPGLDLAPSLDGLERILVRLFLRRYVTRCARCDRFAQMQGAARLFARAEAHRDQFAFANVPDGRSVEND